MVLTVIEETLLPQEISEHPDCKRPNKLNQVTDTKTFTCHGCIEPGAGTRYNLQQDGRSHDYHICCAVAPGSYPMFEDLKLKTEPPEGNDEKGRFCDVCKKAVNRFVYHCSDDSGDVRYYHPCCALRLHQSCKCSRPIDGKPRQPPVGKHRNPFPMNEKTSQKSVKKHHKG
ncbi:hypothetical protein PR202_ga20845 [Eleusine coracana subsp. coracana]|uniref:Uncharacterized protein n=1 Tax=Eleusine coracana subsp. coracana TaxID=191504 RepID=A0AAV5CXP3_ELECO|nr:hypothetical protein PR202_ga20845 [Eleusine coracana subsp. coracana]